MAKNDQVHIFYFCINSSHQLILSKFRTQLNGKWFHLPKRVNDYRGFFKVRTFSDYISFVRFRIIHVSISKEVAT